MSILDCSKLKVTELRAELAARGLATTGLKQELRERLEAAVEQATNADEPEEIVSGEQDQNRQVASDNAVEGESQVVSEVAEIKDTVDAVEEPAISAVPSPVLPSPVDSPLPPPTSPCTIIMTIDLEPIPESTKRTREIEDNDEAGDSKRARSDEDSGPVLESAGEASQEEKESSMKEDDVEPRASREREDDAIMTAEVTTMNEKKSQEDKMPSEEVHIPTPSLPVTESIYLSNLARPFTVVELTEKLTEHGKIEYFWIDSVKSHCYVTYDSVDSAVSAFNALNGVVWPLPDGKALEVMHIPSSRISFLVQVEEDRKKKGLPKPILERRIVRGEWTYDFALIRWNANDARPSQAPRSELSAATGSLRRHPQEDQQQQFNRRDPSHQQFNNAFPTTNNSNRNNFNNSTFQSQSQQRRPLPPANAPTGPSGSSSGSSALVQPRLPSSSVSSSFRQTKAIPRLYYSEAPRTTATTSNKLNSNHNNHSTGSSRFPPSVNSNPRFAHGDTSNRFAPSINNSNKGPPTGPAGYRGSNNNSNASTNNGQRRWG